MVFNLTDGSETLRWKWNQNKVAQGSGEASTNQNVHIIHGQIFVLWPWPAIAPPKNLETAQQFSCVSWMFLLSPFFFNCWDKLGITKNKWTKKNGKGGGNQSILIGNIRREEKWDPTEKNGACQSDKNWYYKHWLSGKRWCSSDTAADIELRRLNSGERASQCVASP